MLKDYDMKNRQPKSDIYGFELQTTYKEIAAEMGITPQRVQQIERRALKKLAERLLAKGYETTA